MEVKNAVVLVTSAGTHLGNTLAMHFAQLGAIVVLCDKNNDQLNQTYLCCQKVTQSVHQYPIQDYSNDSVESLFTYIKSELGQYPDVLINALVPVSMPSLLDSTGADSFSASLSDFTASLFSFCHATACRLKEENKQGVIVNVVWQEGRRTTKGFENTASVITGMTQSWAKELTPFRIRVGAVIPSTDDDDSPSWSELQDELIRNTEYIVSNDYFSGRVMAA